MKQIYEITNCKKGYTMGLSNPDANNPDALSLGTDLLISNSGISRS